MTVWGYGHTAAITGGSVCTEICSALTGVTSWYLFLKATWCPFFLGPSSASGEALETLQTFVCVWWRK